MNGHGPYDVQNLRQLGWAGVISRLTNSIVYIFVPSKFLSKPLHLPNPRFPYGKENKTNPKWVVARVILTTRRDSVNPYKGVVDLLILGARRDKTQKGSWLDFLSATRDKP